MPLSLLTIGTDADQWKDAKPESSGSIKEGFSCD